MMMGVGLLFMLVIGLVAIAIPVLIIVLITGGLAKLFKPHTGQVPPDPSQSLHKPVDERKCPTCGRAVRADWNICPSCGATQT